MIYLDNHSATEPCSAAIKQMQPYLEEHWAASFSPHKMGQQLVSSLDGREQPIYDLVSADESDQFIFTSSGAESVCQVLWSVFLNISRKDGRCHFIASSSEDAPTMQMLKRLEELGCYVKIAPLDKEGKVDLAALKELINPRTALITMSVANGLTGVIQPIEEIAALAKDKNVLLHLDATYAVGKTYFSFSEIGADYLTFSGDRIHSVKGSGALFAKKGAPISSFITKGASIDAPSFMALSGAASQAALYLDAMSLETARLRDLLESKIQNGKPLFKDSLRLPNTTAIAFPGAHQEALLYLLNRKGVFASIGGPYAQHLSRVLIASGIDSQDAESAISFSLSRMTTEEEILKAAAIINECAQLLQLVSEDLFCKQ